MRHRVLTHFAGIAFLGAALSACAPTPVHDVMMQQREGERSVGFFRLMFEDFTSLSTATLERSAAPWKVMAAAMVGYRQSLGEQWPATEASFVRMLEERFGFVVPARIANLPAGSPQPSFARPVGIVSGTLQSRFPRLALEVYNNGCSTCHSAVMYDAKGMPTHDVWVGAPSTSINLDRYAAEAYASLVWASGHHEALLTLVETMFPGVDATEVRTIQETYLPRLDKRIAELSRTINAFTPYSNGSAGLTNGVATIQLYLGVIDASRPHDEQVAFTSIPQLEGLRLRTSVLADGVYTPAGWQRFGERPASMADAVHIQGMADIICIVTMGTLGVTPEVAVRNIPKVRDVIDYLETEYVSPPFPGSVDPAVAERGAALFSESCESCHGKYQRQGGRYRLVSYPNELVPQKWMNSDRERWAAVGEQGQQLFQETPIGPYVDVARTGGYVAPALSGVWQSAPYLHNGSVPTLWHLMHPAERPERFWVGGHRLDLDKVGVLGEPRDGAYAYPADYTPWTLPALYDSRLPGKSRGGHEDQFVGLSDIQKAELIEFLKLL